MGSEMIPSGIKNVPYIPPSSPPPIDSISAQTDDEDGFGELCGATDAYDITDNLGSSSNIKISEDHESSSFSTMSPPPLTCIVLPPEPCYLLPQSCEDDSEVIPEKEDFRSIENCNTSDMDINYKKSDLETETAERNEFNYDSESEQNMKDQNLSNFKNLGLSTEEQQNTVGITQSVSSSLVSGDTKSFSYSQNKFEPFSESKVTSSIEGSNFSHSRSTSKFSDANSPSNDLNHSEVEANICDDVKEHGANSQNNDSPPLPQSTSYVCDMNNDEPNCVDYNSSSKEIDDCFGDFQSNFVSSSPTLKSNHGSSEEVNCINSSNVNDGSDNEFGDFSCNINYNMSFQIESTSPPPLPLSEHTRSRSQGGISVSENKEIDFQCDAGWDVPETNIELGEKDGSFADFSASTYFEKVACASSPVEEGEGFEGIRCKEFDSGSEKVFEAASKVEEFGDFSCNTDYDNMTVNTHDDLDDEFCDFSSFNDVHSKKESEIFGETNLSCEMNSVPLDPRDCIVKNEQNLKQEKSSFTSESSEAVFSLNKENSDDVESPALPSEDEFGDFNCVEETRGLQLEFSDEEEFPEQMTSAPNDSKLAKEVTSESNSFYSKFKSLIMRWVAVPPSPAQEDTPTEFLGKLIDVVESDTFLWHHLQDLDSSLALKLSWPTSHTHKLFLSSLNVDARNILFGHKWTSSIPLFAQTLSFSPLTPAKPSSFSKSWNEETLPSAVEKEREVTPCPTIPKDVEPKTIPPAKFDWSSSGLTNPLDAPEILDDEGTKDSLADFEVVSEAPVAPLPLIEKILKVSSSAGGPPLSTDMASLPQEVKAAVQKLPDLSFMRSKVLMFPIREGI